MTQRVAIVGIDGSGKSALVEALQRRFAGRPGEAVAFHCPNFHETADAPFATLSAELKLLSDVADELRSFELKLADLYLRMTLFGPVEEFFLRTFAPRHLVSDRHPIVDTLVYIPLYSSRAAAAGTADRAALEVALRERLPAGFERILAWHGLENLRLGRETDFWALWADIIEATGGPLEQVLDRLTRRYRTTLPEVVVKLDVDVEEAVRRRHGAGSRELHEDHAALLALHESYERVLRQLEAECPEVEVRRVANAERSVEETAAEVAGLLGLAALR